jgi:hypothetical protein
MVQESQAERVESVTDLPEAGQHCGERVAN